MELKLDDFNYELPEDRIAYYPTDKRDESRLLVFKDRKINHRIFKDLPEMLPPDSLLVFNNSKVVPARIIFETNRGASIEIFVLSSSDESKAFNLFFLEKSPVRVKAFIGNKKKWKAGTSLTRTINNLELNARLIKDNPSIVEFSWNNSDDWGLVMQKFGDIPLPPYIKRATTEIDFDRYQTVYSIHQGAVAAPTAGLHFTEDVLREISRKGIKSEYITLHVGAGTFQPIKTENIIEHRMHSERLVFSKSNIESLLHHDGKIIPVGTTSLRSLESLYWFGNKLVNYDSLELIIDQNYPYEPFKNLLSRKESIKAILKKMDQTGMQELIGSTSIYIRPGYKFRMCDGLVTNFHQPGSTLILLVAALVGDYWKEIYNSALANQYRFLSYGDSSLLIP